MNTQDILNSIKSGNVKSTNDLVNGINSLPTGSISNPITSVDDLKNKIPSKDDIANSLSGLKDKIPSKDDIANSLSGLKDKIPTIPKISSLSKFRPIKPIKLKQLPTPKKFKNKKTI
jgi:hypothetical protein